MSDTKSKVKLAVIIPLVIVFVIGAAVLTLSLIKVNPILDNFGGYSSVEIVTEAGKSYSHVIVDKKDITQESIDSGLNEAKFSVMQGILEGKFSYDISLKNEKVTEDEKEVDRAVTLTSKQLNSYAPGEGEYVLCFWYDKQKEIEVDGNKIKFDRLLLRLRESNGEIIDVECVPYLRVSAENDAPTVDTADENGFIGSDYYTAHALNVKMITSRLMLNVEDILGSIY